MIELKLNRVSSKYRIMMAPMLTIILNRTYQTKTNSHLLKEIQMRREMSGLDVEEILVPVMVVDNNIPVMARIKEAAAAVVVNNNTLMVARRKDLVTMVTAALLQTTPLIILSSYASLI